MTKIVDAIIDRVEPNDVLATTSIIKNGAYAICPQCKTYNYFDVDFTKRLVSVKCGTCKNDFQVSYRFVHV